MPNDPASIATSEWEILDRLTELWKVANEFVEGDHWATRHETDAARAALRLASALRSIDPDTLQRFPRVARHATGDLKTVFNEVMDRWGWQQATGPHDEQFIQERTELDLLDIYLLYLATALSYEKGLRERRREVPPHVKRWAARAQKEGLSPSVPFEEAEATIQDCWTRYVNAMPIARPWEGWNEGEMDRLRAATRGIAEEVSQMKARLGLPIEGILPSGYDNAEPPVDFGEGINAQGRDDEAQATAVAPAVPDDPVPPKLSRTEKDLLKAAYRLQAFSEDSSRSKPEIVRKYDPAKDPVVTDPS
jgi:hypothetical protein